ncbi:hypothetical protein OY671_002733 [Metschnikowia pulcherrima]|nr:hypothetical protein OY671_002733 [Metschnikowia pulcherrima]
MTAAHNGSQNQQDHESSLPEHNETLSNALSAGNGDTHNDPNDDLALENAIGDAFKQFAMFGNEPGHEETETHDENHGEKDEQNAQNGQEEVVNDQKIEMESNLSHADSDAQDQPEPSDTDLAQAVGNLFASLSHDSSAGNSRDLENGQERVGHAEKEGEDVNRDLSQMADGNLPTEARDTQHTEATQDVTMDEHDGEFTEQKKHDQSMETGELFVDQGQWDPQSEQFVETSTSSQAADGHGHIAQDHSWADREYSQLPPEHQSLRESIQTNSHSNVENGQSNEAIDNDDDDLENAIGDAFKNLTEGMSLDQESSHSHGGESSSSHTSNINNANGVSEDENLEDAIGAAFKSLARGLEGSPAESQYGEPAQDRTVAANSERVRSESRHETEPFDAPNNHQDPTDLGDIVHNVVSQIGHLSHTNKPSVADRQAHATGSHENSDTGLPNSAYTSPEEPNEDPSQDLDAALKAAVASAVHSAFPTGSDTAQSQAQDPVDKNSDFEQLQMNEILQNAFNMAMQNPQDLVPSTRPPDQEQDDNSKREQEMIGALSSATAAAALAAREAFEKSKLLETNAEVLTNEKDAVSKKPLSIAETLALHRSNMSTGSQRDYSSIKSLEDSMQPGVHTVQPSAQNHPQLSTILSSLSQHIQSGTHSSNLMSVIRQMTNALMHNKKAPATFSKAAQDLFKGIRNSADEKEFYMESLNKSKQFILSMTDDDVRAKTLAFVDSIVEQIETPKPKKSQEREEPASDEQFKQKLEDDLPQLYEATFSNLTNVDIPRLRMAIAGIKPDVDSTEHKSRIREGNRERKKKWREENAERNKDNDLRCRVLKRAATKFGETSTEEKLLWIEKEYTKRRNRRISRQKKDEVKAESPPPSDESPMQEPLLVKRITESFNLVTECGHNEDPRAVLSAICATTAVVASTCAEALEMTDPLIISDAISSIMHSLFEASMKSGSSRKFDFLVKREENQFTTINSPESTREELMRKVSALNALNTSAGSSSPAMSTLEALRQSQKRLGLDYLDSIPKRPKAGASDADFNSDADFESGAKILASPPPSNNSWSSSGSLKMPQYKIPSASGTVTDPELVRMDLSRREFVEPIPKIASPFISNKLGSDSNYYSSKTTLKKPGSLQRPGFSKPASKANSLGFPTLYSTSFRST